MIWIWVSKLGGTQWNFFIPPFKCDAIIAVKQKQTMKKVTALMQATLLPISL